MRKKPPEVLRAIYERNTELLSFLGKKGAESKKRRRQEQEQLKRELLFEEFQVLAEEANEHICPVD